MVYWKNIRYWIFVKIKKILLKNIESINLARISKENLDASINGTKGTIMTLNYFWWMQENIDIWYITCLKNDATL